MYVLWYPCFAQYVSWAYKKMRYLCYRDFYSAFANHPYSHRGRYLRGDRVFVGEEDFDVCSMQG